MNKLAAIAFYIVAGLVPRIIWQVDTSTTPGWRVLIGWLVLIASIQAASHYWSKPSD